MRSEARKCKTQNATRKVSGRENAPKKNKIKVMRSLSLFFVKRKGGGTALAVGGTK